MQTIEERVLMAVDEIVAELRGDPGYDIETYYYDYHGKVVTEKIPKPVSTSIEEAWLLEETIEDTDAYLTHLIRVVNHDRGISEDDFNTAGPGSDWLMRNEDVWAMVHATPLQRARAYCLANGIKRLEIE